ncbi:hypothetical protein N657DRAFT_267170 [Parathielavia appendiculata]|uniref:Uncharacterized protein n=1 Tax=Parathielavia appendiculata TaxID=2587402 RepID=A0AAN6Z4M4_9PEZI|nr:hypothetical protein N657DRAFT_267170 [Parathielavia appendiculata]
MGEPKMEDDPQVLSMATTLEAESLSRDSSEATQTSTAQNLAHSLAGISAVSAGSPSSDPQQSRPIAIAPAMYPASGTSHASTAPAPGGNLVREHPDLPFSASTHCKNSSSPTRQVPGGCDLTDTLLASNWSLARWL